MTRWPASTRRRPRSGRPTPRSATSSLDLAHANESGIVELRGGLDLPDALDLDAALAARAAVLGRLGCEDSLDVRRSLALGDLARDHLGQDDPPRR